MVQDPVATVYPGGSTNILIDMGRLMPSGWLPRSVTAPVVVQLRIRLRATHGIELWATSNETTSWLDARLFWKLSDEELALATFALVELATRQDQQFPPP